MKFRVIGSNRETGARMTLEFDADSKAAAERKAASLGMSVNRVEAAGDGDSSDATKFREKSTGGGGAKWVVLVVALLATGWWLWRSGRLHVHF